MTTCKQEPGRCSRVTRNKRERERDRGQRECDPDEGPLRPGGSTHDTYRKDGSECGAHDDAEPE